MKNALPRYRVPVILTLLGLVGLWFYFDSKSGSTDESEVSGFQSEEQRERTRSRSEKGVALTGEEVAQQDAKENLNGLLPQWLREKGELYQENHDLNGQSVLRSRARYEWEDGRRVEIEISDMGAGGDPQLAQSLGFNLAQANEESDSGYTMTQADEVYLLNEEYDHNDQAGSLQMLIEKRYLLEIQIESLPHEAFQELLDEDVPFEQLFIGARK